MILRGPVHFFLYKDKGKNMSNTSILDEADTLINGPRSHAYGCPLKLGRAVSAMWSKILDAEVTPEQVNLCMIALKIARECNRPHRDNLVDIAGYAGVIEKIQQARKGETK